MMTPLFKDPTRSNLGDGGWNIKTGHHTVLCRPFQPFQPFLFIMGINKTVWREKSETKNIRNFILNVRGRLERSERFDLFNGFNILCEIKGWNKVGTG